MVRIEKLHRGFIKEYGLGFFKTYAVFVFICFVLGWIPSEMYFVHNYNVIMVCRNFKCAGCDFYPGRALDTQTKG